MPNLPNRSRLARAPAANPTPEEIRAAREGAGLTQAQAAAVVHRPSYRTWQDWERGVARMPLDAWELFLLKTNQHPKAQLVAR